MLRHQYPLLIIPELPTVMSLIIFMQMFEISRETCSYIFRVIQVEKSHYEKLSDITVESSVKVIVVSIICLVVPSPPTDVRLTSIMNNSESASVTIEWDPPSQGGSPLNYTITTTPDLISGPSPVTTSTSTTITINYNTDYTITITASNCAGSGIPSDVLSVNIGEFNIRFY